VKNPGMHLPYIATIVISVGLLWQFLSSLGKFNKRRSRDTDRKAESSKGAVNK
jgi:hypothetical protein